MIKFNNTKGNCTWVFIAVFYLFFTSPLFAGEKSITANQIMVELSGNITNAYNGQNYMVQAATNNDFYKNEIAGNEFAVNINNIPEGSYSVNIYLAEHHVNTAGKRVFSITSGNTSIVENLDIFSLAGMDKELIISGIINCEKTENQGKLKIDFKGISGAAKFNAIEITKKSGEIIVLVLASQFENKAMISGNPFVKQIFTADPSAHVFEDKMYVYPSHDRDDAKGFNMTDYHVFSSPDLLKWEDHGVALDVKDVPWAKEFMWAPDCVYKNGLYYYYFPARDKAGEFRIGVATGKSPAGPFVPELNPIKGSFSVDPAVFIDNDGQAYMYFGGAGMGGQKTPWVAKMTADMKEFSEVPKALAGVDYWFEACWMNKIGNTYFLSYSTGGAHPNVKGSSGIAYATSDNPMGPFIYQGLVNEKVTGWTNHHSIVEWKGQTWFFYHTSDLSGGKTNKRCIAADFLHVTGDGKIHTVKQTKTGIGRYDGLGRIEAENYSEKVGVIKKISDDGTIFVAFSNSDIVVFKNIDFSEKQVKTLELSITTESNKGELEIREKDIKGRLLAKIRLKNSGGEQKWKTINTNVTALKGKNDLVFIYKGKKNDSLNVNWLMFHE